METRKAAHVLDRILFQPARTTTNIPERGTAQAAGLDLCADIAEPVLLWGGKCMVVPTGVSVAIPFGYVGLVCPSSGLAVKHGITILNSPGVIDADYRGEIMAVLQSHAPFDKAYSINPGDRVAQLVIVPCWMGALTEVTKLPETERGTNGFGSSGR